MFRTLKSLFALLALCFLIGGLNQSSGQFLFVTGGNVRLTIGAPSAPGFEPQPDTDAGRRVVWLFPPRFRTKIVVSTIAPGQDFDLYLEPQAVLSGTGQPEVQLFDGMSPQDFVRNIRRNSFFGRANLGYRAEAPAASGNSVNNGDDVHTVVFTWVAQ